MNFLNRFPSRKQLVPVYAVAVAVIYGWSMLRFFWRLPSLLNYSTVGDIGIIFSYLIAVNFFESLAVVSVPVIFSLILPRKWFYDQFITMGVLLVSLGLGYMIFVESHINEVEAFPYTLFQWMPLVFLAILVFVLFVGRIAFLKRVLEDISERFEIFLFISIPISVIAILVVLIRNIF